MLLALIFAQTQPEATTPLQLPVSYGGLTIAAIGGVIVLFLVAGFLLKELQGLRTAIVTEVKRELSTPVEPQPISLPQPFSVQPHVSFTPIDDHNDLAADLKEFMGKVDQRFIDQALASSASRDKIYALIRDQGAKLQTEVKQDMGGVHTRLTELFTAIGRVEGRLLGKK